MELSEDKKTELEEISQALKKKYRVRSFKTTTEAITFLQKVMPLFSSIGNGLENFESEDISKLFDLFPAEIIKYLVSTFVEVKDNKKWVGINYEEEFKGDFQTLLAVFVMALTHLVKEVETKKGKPPAKQKKIISQSRE